MNCRNYVPYLLVISLILGGCTSGNSSSGSSYSKPNSTSTRQPSSFIQLKGCDRVVSTSVFTEVTNIEKSIVPPSYRKRTTNSPLYFKCFEPNATIVGEYRAASSNTFRLHGYATKYYGDGSIYSGYFENGKPHGYGWYCYNQSNNITEGTFRNGDPHGYAVYRKRVSDDVSISLIFSDIDYKPPSLHACNELFQDKFAISSKDLVDALTYVKFEGEFDYGLATSGIRYGIDFKDEIVIQNGDTKATVEIHGQSIETYEKPDLTTKLNTAYSIWIDKKGFLPMVHSDYSNADGRNELKEITYVDLALTGNRTSPDASITGAADLKYSEGATNSIKSDINNYISKLNDKIKTKTPDYECSIVSSMKFNDDGTEENKTAYDKKQKLHIKVDGEVAKIAPDEWYSLSLESRGQLSLRGVLSNSYINLKHYGLECTAGIFGGIKCSGNPKNSYIKHMTFELSNWSDKLVVKKQKRKTSLIKEYSCTKTNKF